MDSVLISLATLGPLQLIGTGAVLGGLLIWAFGATSRARFAERAAHADRLEERLNAAMGDLLDEKEHSAELTARLAAEREAHTARLDELRKAQQELSQKFDQLAGDALGKNSDRFLKLVTERFQSHEATAARDLEKRQQAIADLLKPVNETLNKFQTQVGEIEKARAGAYAQIATQVKSLAEGQTQLRGETANLVKALRRPQTRGRWGEFQLRQVFEMADMAEHVNFLEQTQIEGTDGRQRPDAVVQLPGGKTIIIDAKTPLEGYLNALEAEEDPDAQAAHLAQHARHVRTHVDLLASKRYYQTLPGTPDFVVMFIPGEAFYSVAVEQDPGIVDHAVKNRVLIASPTTLIALLKAVGYGWQQERLAANMVEVQKTARELYDRLKTYGGHMDRLGKSLGTAVNSYNSAVGSLEGRVLPSARKFENFGVVSGETQPTPTSVETAPRTLSDPDLDR